MARGWESKSVEDQMADAEVSRNRTPAPEMTREERARHQRKAMLTLSRAKVLHDLGTATDVRYRELLERSLAHIDAELEAFTRS